MTSILLLNGPNLNLLGHREPELYGATTLAEIEAELATKASDAGYRLESFQSNAEHLLVERVQTLLNDPVTQFVILNPAALTHTSVMLRDALLAVNKPFIEVHISNIFSRESFRHHSYFSDISQGLICGLGVQGYTLALDAAIAHLNALRREDEPEVQEF
jgi:3-dehydroquinate dehydratase-2